MTPARDASFLVIRRDNIGDLVCTTPVFEALRTHFPAARIFALTNSYNLPVLRGNPFIDEAFAYTKGKHREAGRSLWNVYADRLRLVMRLRRMRLDYAIVGSCGVVPRALAFARLVRPKHIVSHVPRGNAVRGVDVPVAHDWSKPLHEVEVVYTVLSPFGITGRPPAPAVFPAPDAERQVRAALEARRIAAPIGVHISSRRPSNRWPVEQTAELLRRMHAAHGSAFVLFWSPGDEHDPRHPGDDRKAARLIEQLRDVPLLPYATHRLEDLIAGLSACERVICSDGGAMHIAAALGKPILCFFGDSNPVRWRPWNVPHVLLQPPSGDAADITVDEAYEGFERLVLASSAPSKMPA